MSAIATLEKSVIADIDAGKFNIDTAATLFKEYNMAKAYNKDAIVKILFRSLANVNTADFDALYVQLPQTFTATIAEEKAVLIELDNLLHAAQFAAFWPALAAAKAKLNTDAAKIEEAVRATIVLQLSRAVVSIGEKEAAEALSVAQSDLAKAFASVEGGVQIVGGKVVFPANNTNHGGPVKKAADVTLEKLVALQQ